MSKQSIFSIVLILVLILTGYVWYGYVQAPGGDTASSQNQNSQTLQVSRLQNIQLDASLLSDPLFTVLSPPQIIPQPDVAPGRINPFAPF